MPTHFNGSEKEKLALDVYIKLSRATETISGLVNAHLQAHRLTISQFGVLESLYHLGPMQTSELGTKILKSSGNMTLVIDNLEKRALIRRERGQKDRRCIEIHLTEAGNTLIAEILPGHIAGVVDAIEILTQEEQQTLNTLCRKLGRRG
ncbi:MAG: MarR family winged helix-turn-helix transcriptional regulator [Rhodothermales bacterium]